MSEKIPAQNTIIPTPVELTVFGLFYAWDTLLNRPTVLGGHGREDEKKFWFFEALHQVTAVGWLSIYLLLIAWQASCIKHNRPAPATQYSHWLPGSILFYSYDGTGLICLLWKALQMLRCWPLASRDVGWRRGDTVPVALLGISPATKEQMKRKIDT